MLLKTSSSFQRVQITAHHQAQQNTWQQNLSQVVAGLRTIIYTVVINGNYRACKLVISAAPVRQWQALLGKNMCALILTDISDISLTFIALQSP